MHSCSIIHCDDIVRHRAPCSAKLLCKQIHRYIRTYIPTYLCRIVHSHDIVPHLAPCCAGCSMSETCPHHHGVEIYYPEQDMEQGMYVVCKESGEDPYCSNRNGKNLSTKDHTSYFVDDVGALCRTPGEKV